MCSHLKFVFPFCDTVYFADRNNYCHKPLPQMANNCQHAKEKGQGNIYSDNAVAKPGYRPVHPETLSFKREKM